MDIKAINIAIQNANKVTVELANQGLFAEAGVIHSLTQAVRVIHNVYNETEKARINASASENKAIGLLNQIGSDLRHSEVLHPDTVLAIFSFLNPDKGA